MLKGILERFGGGITKDPKPLDIGTATNVSNAAAKDEQMTGGDDKKGVMMLAKPTNNDDHEFNLYEDPKAKTGNQKVTAPTPVRVDMSDTIDNYVKVTEVPEHPEIKPGYGYKGSVRNTDAIFKAMEAGGFGSDKTERDVYLANINHESGKGRVYAEDTNYGYKQFTGFKRESECGAKPGTAGNEQGKGANGQATKYCAAYVAAGLSLESDFASWDSAKKANLMYGVEGKTLPNGTDTNLGDSAKYSDLGNTNANDGNRYRGRGAIQLTGKSNYESLNKKLNKVDESGKSPYQKVTGTNDTVDIVSNPESVSNDEYLANLVSALYWRDSVHSAVAGKDAEAALKSSRQKVNSGCGVSEVTTQYNQLEGYEAAYETYQNEKSGVPAADQKASDNSGEIVGHSKGNNQNETPAIDYPSIDVESAIEYNKNKNPGMLEYIQTYLGLEKTSEFDELTVKTIAKWQKESNVLDVDGKFGDCSYDYAMKHGLDKIMPPMLDEVVVTGDKDKSSGNKDKADADDASTPKGDSKPKEDKKDEPDPAGLYTESETINKGSTNKSAIKTIQYYLKKYGFEHGSEGKYDVKTFKNVMYYQFTRNLADVDGVVGSKSWAAFRDDPGAVYKMDDTIGYVGGVSKKITLGDITDGNGNKWKIATKAVQPFNDMQDYYKEKHNGKGLKITSTYRAMTSAGTKAAGGCGVSGQIELYANYKYGVGGQALAAKPGTSNHQSGIAIDFDMTTVKDKDGNRIKENGRYVITEGSKPLEEWLIKNGPSWDFYNIDSEPWHYDYKG